MEKFWKLVFFPLRPVRDKSGRVRMAANVFILDATNVE